MKEMTLKQNAVDLRVFFYETCKIETICGLLEDKDNWET